METFKTFKKEFNENNLEFELTKEEKDLYFIAHAIINIEMLEITLGSPYDLSLRIENTVMGIKDVSDINLQSYPNEINKKNGVYKFDTKHIDDFNKISPNIKIAISSLSNESFKLAVYFRAVH